MDVFHSIADDTDQEDHFNTKKQSEETIPTSALSDVLVQPSSASSMSTTKVPGWFIPMIDGPAGSSDSYDALAMTLNWTSIQQRFEDIFAETFTRGKNSKKVWFNSFTLFWQTYTVLSSYHMLSTNYIHIYIQAASAPSQHPIIQHMHNRIKFMISIGSLWLAPSPLERR